MKKLLKLIQDVIWLPEYPYRPRWRPAMPHDGTPEDRKRYERQSAAVEANWAEVEEWARPIHFRRRLVKIIRVVILFGIVTSSILLFLSGCAPEEDVLGSSVVESSRYGRPNPETASLDEIHEWCVRTSSGRKNELACVQTYLALRGCKMEEESG